MTVSLPKGIDAYIAGTNAHEPDAIAQAFAEDGIVHDEGKVQRPRGNHRMGARYGEQISHDDDAARRS